jgi:capsular polysaccharide biosynthesis protein
MPEAASAPGAANDRAAPAARSRSALHGATALLRRAPRWWPLPVCVAAGVLGGAVYAASAPPQYDATSYVVVAPGKGGDPASALGYAQAYGKIATDAVVLGGAEAKSWLPHGSLRSRVRARTSPDAPMVQITGTGRSPKQAADFADAVASSLTRTAGASARTTGVRLSVVSHAAPPAAPVSPSAPIALSVGGCAGGLVGGLVLLTRPRQHSGTYGAVAVPGPGPASASPPDAVPEPEAAPARGGPRGPESAGVVAR